ncbi:MAG: type II secretion system F family protein [Mycoplasmatales bacterium]
MKLVLNKNLKKLFKSGQELNKQHEILSFIDKLLHQGYSINECINLLSFRYNLSSWKENFLEGNTFCNILIKEKYDNDVLLIIEVSEKSNNLKKGIHNSVNVLEQKINNRQQAFELIKYPILLFLVITISILFISGFLIPQFNAIFDQYSMSNNILITMLFKFITLIPFICIILAIIIIFFILKIIKMDQLTRKTFLLSNVFIKKHYITLYNYIFTINFSNLLSIGLRLDEVLNILKQQSYNYLLKEEAINIIKNMEQGKTLSESINKKYYSKELIYLLEDGVQNNTLVHNLKSYSIFLSNINKKKTQKLLFLIQPIFYSIFGLIIILLYAAIFLPMFKMMDQI